MAQGPSGRELVGWLLVTGLAGWLAYVYAPALLYGGTAGAAAFWLTREAKQTRHRARVAWSYGRPLADLQSTPQWATPIDLRTRMRIALLEEAGRIAFWFCLGALAVLAVQLGLNLFRDAADPAGIGAAEWKLYTLGLNLAEVATPVNAILFLGAALLVTMLLKSWWPLATIGWARRAAAAGASFLLAATSFTFVAATGAAEGYEVATAPIRADIARDLGRIRQARMRHAALQWLASDLAHRAETEPRFRARWRRYFELGAAQCARANALYRAGYRERAGFDPQETYCDPAGHLLRLAELRRRGGGAGQGRDPAAWIPEFSLLVDIVPPPDGTPGEAVAVPKPRLSLPVLAAMGRRARGTAATAEAAERGAQDALVDIARGVFGDQIGGAAGAMIVLLRDAGLEALAGETRERIAARLALLRTGIGRWAELPAALSRLWATPYPIETPPLELVTAAAGDILDEAWRAAHPDSPPVAESRRFGRNQAPPPAAGSGSGSGSGDRGLGRGWSDPGLGQGGFHGSGMPGTELPGRRGPTARPFRGR